MDLKEQLIAAGVASEAANKIVGAVHAEYAPKFNEIIEENKALKAQLSERDKQLTELEKSTGDNADLKKKIEEIQALNVEKDKYYAAEISKLKLDNAVDMALMQAGAKNLKAVRGVLELEKMQMDKDGNVIGLREALDKVKQSDSYLFAENNAPEISGISPAPSRDELPGFSFDVNSMSCSEAMIAANRAAERK